MRQVRCKLIDFDLKLIKSQISIEAAQDVVLFKIKKAPHFLTQPHVWIESIATEVTVSVPLISVEPIEARRGFIDSVRTYRMRLLTKSKDRCQAYINTYNSYFN